MTDQSDLLRNRPVSWREDDGIVMVGYFYDATLVEVCSFRDNPLPLHLMRSDCWFIGPKKSH
ncbi:hypothetical protein RBSH_05391 [Rhodopirellula baltica SH28]|uniref:Uncharacterized protein n=1 Tax=Rhodopirellula baltica SH28 TaxID=993517 RepID=K5DA73_RHOBT|nr:hypothetical protein [Rhodopirellula baltica]EKJ99342.1 hypothetical protein RBSH_05391 [Rhodopirellula baltica SH28]